MYLFLLFFYWIFGPLFFIFKESSWIFRNISPLSVIYVVNIPFQFADYLLSLSMVFLVIQILKFVFRQKIYSSFIGLRVLIRRYKAFPTSRF